MNKLTKLLSVFIIAGAVGAGVAGVAGCKTGGGGNNGGGHEHNYTYTQNADGKTHNGTCDVDGCDKPTITNETCADGNDADSLCDKCKGEISSTSTGDELEVPANTRKLIIEGVTPEVQLSTTNTSHTIDKNAIKVYLADTNGAKTSETEVPKANYEIHLYDPAEAESASWQDLKANGEYTISVKLKNCKWAAGGPSADVNTITSSVKVNVKNGYVANSLVVKAGATLTQVQSATDSMTPTWTYEVTLENGEKETVPAAEVTVSGLVTTTATENGEATITWKGITGTVNYTITEDTTKVSQSFALNFNTLDKTDITAEGGATVADGRFVIYSNKSADIVDHGKSFDGKYIAKRYKPGGKSNAQANNVYIKIHVDGTAKITVYSYVTSGSADTETDRLVALVTGYKGDKDTDYGTVVNNQKYNTHGQVDEKHVFNVDAAGDYYLLSMDGDICFTYIQVDQLVSAEGNSEITLGGTVENSAIELDTSNAKKVYKVGESLDTSDVTVKAIGVNSVTLDATNTVVTTGITYSPVNMSTLGEKEVTVTYNDGTATFTATYKITVESAVAGVKGATAKLKSTLNTVVETDAGTVTLKPDDIEVALEWTKNEVEGLTTTFVVKHDNVEIDATAGKPFGIGTYTLTVVVTVSDGTNEAEFTVEVELEVTKQLGEGEYAEVTVNLGGVTIKDKTGAEVTLVSDKTPQASGDTYDLYSGTTKLIVSLDAGAQWKPNSAYMQADGKNRNLLIDLSAYEGTKVNIIVTVCGSKKASDIAADSSKTSYIQLGSDANTKSQALPGNDASNAATNTVTFENVNGGSTVKINNTGEGVRYYSVKIVPVTTPVE